MLNKILSSKWLTPLAIVLLGIMSFQLIKITPRYQANSREIKDVEQKIAEADKSLKEIERNKDIADNESYLDRLARLKLNLMKPDEKVVFMYESPYNEQTSTPSATASSSLGLWGRIKNWIKGN